MRRARTKRMHWNQFQTGAQARLRQVALFCGHFSRVVVSGPSPRTSFHHQPEAQQSSAIHKLGRADYPIFRGVSLRRRKSRSKLE
jgi:hypothetical protein